MEDGSLDSSSVWRLDTFIVPPGALEARAVSLSESESRHALGASRARPGDRVRLIDGEGAEALALVEDSAGGKARLTVLEARVHERSRSVRLTIVQALPKGRGMDEVVRRCGELGVDAVVPAVTERTIVRPGPEAVGPRLERWRSVAEAAAKQSRGVFVTRVREPAAIEDLETLVRESGAAITAWEEEGGTMLRDLLRGPGVGRDFVAVVGPEGGLCEREVEMLRGWGASPAGLGRRVLRSDWAAAAVAAMVSYELGGLLP